MNGLHNENLQTEASCILMYVPQGLAHVDVTVTMKMHTA
jgi:hypothetical protein